MVQIRNYNKKNINISFIIPAYNEEKYLPKVLAAIQELVSSLTYEIIVVDNGSTDSTVNIAHEFGAMLLQDSSKTVAGLRNLGAEHATGDVLIFLDGDVIITEGWSRNIFKVLSSMKQNNRIITGSRCGISLQPTWIERYWFAPMIQERSNYMNSGHLIISRAVFYEIGRFDGSLVTGEDWEFSIRAKQKEIAIINNQELRVIHEGYPKTLRQFIRREKWHGIQDASNMRSFFKSKPAILAILYWLSGILGIVLSTYYGIVSYVLIGVIINAAICIFATVNKQKQFPLNKGAYFLLYNVYFFARGLSFIELLFKKISYYALNLNDAS